ncbi:hypothetical protein L7F22_069370 [Adiantum nelumboides]|nr:hypothetical protein [Adiantum nelumboides]
MHLKMLMDTINSNSNEWLDVSIPYGTNDWSGFYMYTRAQRSSIDVCLARSTPDGDAPFVSMLELRPLPSTLTAATPSSFVLDTQIMEYQQTPLSPPQACRIAYLDAIFELLQHRRVISRLQFFADIYQVCGSGALVVAGFLWGQNVPGAKSENQGRQPCSLKPLETVSSEGTWCCLACTSSLPSSPGTPSQLFKSKFDLKLGLEEATHKQNHTLEGNSANAVTSETAQEAIYRKLERKKRSGEMNRAGEVLKTGEIAALLKQGFIPGSSALEKGSGSPFKICVSPGRVSPLVDSSSAATSPSAPSFAKLNSLLTTGFLSQSSPPQVGKKRSSPTLFEMMVHEQETQEKAMYPCGPLLPSQAKQTNTKHLSLQDRVLSASSPGNQFNDAASSDVKLTLSSGRDGVSVTINVHSQIVAAQSRFFAAKLSNR